MDFVKNKFKYLREHSFVKNTATLQAGGMFGNILQAIAGIIIARILQPELFGVYSLVFSLSGTITIILGSLGAADAVTTILGEAYAKNESNRGKEALAFLAKIVILTGIITLIGAALSPTIANMLYQDKSIGLYAAVVIIATVISTTAYSFSSIALQLVGRIRELTVLGLADQLTKTSIVLVLVSLGFGVGGIVTGHLASAIIIFVTSAFIWKSIQRRSPFFPYIRELLRGVRKVSIKKYLNFSVLIAVDKRLSRFYSTLPVLLLGIYVSTSDVTFFKLAFSYTNLALGFLAPIGILLNVEFPKMKVLHEERLAKNFVRVSLYSLALSAVLTIGAAVVAPIAFRVLYGDSFLPSVNYVYGLVPYGVLMGLGIGIGSMLRAINRVSFSIKLHLGSLVVGIPLGIFFIERWGVWGAIIIVTSWYVFVHSVSFIYVLRVLKKERHLITTDNVQ